MHLSPIRATCPAHLILLDFITRTILCEQYRSFSSSLCNHLHSPITSYLLGPNILLNAMFSNTLSFLSSRIVSDQVSHPYKTTGKIIVLYILIFKVPYYDCIDYSRKVVVTFFALNWAYLFVMGWLWDFKKWRFATQHFPAKSAYVSVEREGGT